MHSSGFFRIKPIARLILKCKILGSHMISDQSLLLSTIVLNDYELLVKRLMLKQGFILLPLLGSTIVSPTPRSTCTPSCNKSLRCGERFVHFIIRHFMLSNMWILFLLIVMLLHWMMMKHLV